MTGKTWSSDREKLVWNVMPKILSLLKEDTSLIPWLAPMKIWVIEGKKQLAFKELKDRLKGFDDDFVELLIKVESDGWEKWSKQSFMELHDMETLVQLVRKMVNAPIQQVVTFKSFNSDFYHLGPSMDSVNLICILS
jgi:hypothetical protein